MAIRKTLVREADATYNYFDTRVYEMSAVLYALDDQKIFTLAFYCKAATRLVEMYYAQKPDFQEQEERLSKEIERIKEENDKYRRAMQENCELRRIAESFREQTRKALAEQYKLSVRITELEREKQANE